MTWSDIINDERNKEYFVKLKTKVDNAYEASVCYPPKEKIFNAFGVCKYDELKVVILGQDPYHGANQAMGLAFSTPANIPNPPSMRNILKEINDDTKMPSACANGDLSNWAKQGVLLLNTTLTVEDGKPRSHVGFGWEIFSDNIIKHISLQKSNIVFLLWGSDAIKKQSIIDTKKHFVLTAAHPSPLSVHRGFFGCKHFTKCNQYLIAYNKKSIDW